MYGYDDEMPVQLLEWFRNNCDKVFLFCFAIGAVKDRREIAEFMWYKAEGMSDDGFEIYDLRRFAKVIHFAMSEKGKRASMVRPNDELQIGSTIAFPFGNLQQHENKKANNYHLLIVHYPNYFMKGAPLEYGNDVDLALCGHLLSGKIFVSHIEGF